jgi:hypothetical protein
MSQRRTCHFELRSSYQPQSGYHIRTLPTQVTHARADGINVLDMSIIKNNRITERLRMQLRADFFNSLNGCSAGVLRSASKRWNGWRAQLAAPFLNFSGTPRTMA